jgi:hypothetical protein
MSAAAAMSGVVTCHACSYVSMRLLGEGPDAPGVVQARNWVRRQQLLLSTRLWQCLTQLQCCGGLCKISARHTHFVLLLHVGIFIS